MKYRYIKRVFDIFISFMLLVLISPFFLFISCLVYITSKGPVFYNQERVGRNEKLFSLLKFRSMFMDADKKTVKYQEISLVDKNITPIGKIIRRFKIDELPQIINVIKGDMSIVGPRPYVKNVFDDLNVKERKRVAVRPGLTGLSQVNGNIYLTTTERSYYDVKYVECLSFKIDMKIILKTIIVIVFGEKKFLNKPKIEKDE